MLSEPDAEVGVEHRRVVGDETWVAMTSEDWTLQRTCVVLRSWSWEASARLLYRFGHKRFWVLLFDEFVLPNGLDDGQAYKKCARGYRERGAGIKPGIR
jgi:hypothetical protein